MRVSGNQVVDSDLIQSGPCHVVEEGRTGSCSLKGLWGVGEGRLAKG